MRVGYPGDQNINWNKKTMPTKSLQGHGKMGFTWIICRSPEMEILPLSVQNKKGST
ncbi:hypothetical protein DPMN_155312 [Dreissena polymorpha]|uniref:Uncharacterized protein n=1 Tax=Dreissena polymorpha TaxID=45954 RepID=A0A9D4FM10_DREPO|nr:hypothetical protein DPMN_155312 [Dreissena polymorpha]